MAVLPLALALPVASILLIALAGGRHARAVALGSLVLGGGVTAVMTTELWSTGEPLSYLSGAWPPRLESRFALTDSPSS
jgi:hypothetical protein